MALRRMGETPMPRYKAARAGTPVRESHTGAPCPCQIFEQTAYFAMSLRAFKGRTLMTRRAGFALNICSCFVKGLMPL